MHSNERSASHAAASGYERPQLHRFGTFRDVTRQGFTGNNDGGLILGPDGTSTPAADAFQGGSR